MESKKKIKICFAASSGGHYEPLMMLKPLMEEYESFVITEKTDYDAKAILNLVLNAICIPIFG